MSILSDQLARSLDARDAGAARFGAAAALDHALALERVWERRAAGLLVHGGTPDDGGAARHLAAAAACCWRRGTMLVELELPESELCFGDYRAAIGAGGVYERIYLLARRDLLLLGLGLELFEPATVAGFMRAWLDARPRSEAVAFVWTPLSEAQLATRYGGELWYRFAQQFATVEVPA